MIQPLPAQILASPIMLLLIAVLLVTGVLMFVVRQYRRCPSNRVLVVYGKVGGNQAARCIHGGGVFVIPLFQDYQYLSLEPVTIDIELTGALSKKNIRVNVPSTFTVGVSTELTIMNNAAERLLGLRESEISAQARDIILGQMRLVIATLSIEEINQDREKFLDLVNRFCAGELLKIGLEVINVNIRDITDESGYIDAIGKNAAAEAIQKAKVEVAEQEKQGAIGESTANRAKEVEVANQVAASNIGQKQAEREQRISVAKLEAEGLASEALSRREQEVAIAEQDALSEEGKKQAEASQRVRIATLEADAVKGENESEAMIADYNATLSERRAKAKRRGEVAHAEAARDVLVAEKEQELARLEKEQLSLQEVERQRVQIEADAEADRVRRVAKGEADAVLAKYNAEADGVRRVLEAKADGYRELLKVCEQRPDLAATLLVVEKLPDLVAEQVKAVQNLKIDKVTVWDSGSGRGANGTGQNGATADFVRGLASALPPLHDLARQAGIDLPGILGTVSKEPSSSTASKEPSDDADSE